MSDQNTPSAGDPIDEPKADHNVVDQANEALAEAEAASAAPESTDERRVDDEAPAESAPEAVVVETPVDEAPAVDDADDVPWYDRPESVPMDDDATDEAAVDAAAVAGAAAAASAAAAPAASTPPTVIVAEPAAPTVQEPAYVEPAFVANQQPIFVQAPEAPRPQGNRAAAGLIGLLAAVVFAILSFGIILGFSFLTGSISVETIAADALSIAASPLFWTPVVVFFVAFWLLGAIINRGRWGHWVIWGLLVGFATYAGYVLGVLFDAPFWTLTARGGLELVRDSLFAPYAIVSLVLGRELTIWFGAWVARRGKKVTEQNEEAQREYERTLEAGPQFAQV